jgi:hypothetical protein
LGGKKRRETDDRSIEKLEKKRWGEQICQCQKKPRSDGSIC